MAVKYRERRKHRTRFENRVADHLARTARPESSQKGIVNVRDLASLAERKVTRKAIAAQTRALRAEKVDRPLKSKKPASIADLLMRVDSFAASNPVVLTELVTRDGTVYPLRRPITIVVKHAVKNAEAFVHELKWLQPLLGRGTSDDLALKAFSEGFHHLVNAHHRKPLHLRTDQDQKINRVLDHLVDWNQFELLNPIEQPLWGRVGIRDSAGNMKVSWVIGPGGETNNDSLIFAADVVDELKAIPEGHWFYGAGRVFEDRIEWTSRPVEAPDPHDPRAIEQAWDIIPPHIMSDSAAWPLKQQG